MTENDSRINEDVGCSDEAAVRKQLIINENIWFQRNFGSRFLVEVILFNYFLFFFILIFYFIYSDYLIYFNISSILTTFTSYQGVME